VSKREGPEPPNREDLPTPPPVVRDSAVPEPIGGGDSRGSRLGSREGMSGQRNTRPPGPPERSGPIGIARGDFSTPVTPKRTTTQPRLPVVTVPTATEVAAGHLDAEVEARTSLATPPPSNGKPPPPPTPLGAEPEVPFAVRQPMDVRDEAALLAAEAAAVRALDSGPITPPPELDDPGPTPPPSPAPTAQPDMAHARSVLARLKEAPPQAPPPRVAGGVPGGTPTPTPGAALDPDRLAVMETTPPPLPQPTPAPAVQARQAEPEPVPVPVPEVLPVLEAVPEAAFEPPPEPELEPEPELTPIAAAPAEPPAPDHADAIPTSAIGSESSGAVVEEAESTPTPTPLSLEDEGEVAGDDDLEVAEPATVAPPPPPVALSGPTRTPPPPIPGRYLKTPAPEMRSSDAGEAGSPPRAGVPPLPILPEALAQRPRRPKRSKPWFEEVFDEDYLRTLPFMTAEQTLREVDFIEHSLELSANAKVLDVGCGYGRHAIELVSRGLNVTGLDLSLPLLIRAADESQRRALSVNFVHADMREMVFEDQFDGAYSMLTSFGYFDEEANLRVLEGIARAVRPGGRFLLDVLNRDYIVSDLPSRAWWEGNGCVVLEEVDFNFHTSRIITHRSIVFDDGRQLEQEISIRAYSLHEIGRLLRQAGFRVIDISGALATRGHFFGSTSRNLLVLAERRTDES
jgi:SAM-dependent methyltransferase